MGQVRYQPYQISEFNPKPFVVGRITAPKICLLIGTTSDYVMLHGKRDFPGMIKVKDLTWTDYPGLPK